MKQPVSFYNKKARDIRRKTFLLTPQARGGHLGSSFSAIDILTALYYGILRIDPEKPKEPNRDRFIMSKGHAAAGLYVTLCERGFFSPQKLGTYLSDGSVFGGHVNYYVPGVEFSTGSLGHGLSIGAGVALSAKLDKKKYRSYVLLSDGECDEGSVWEAALVSGHFRLDNLVAIVDYNKIQSFGRVKDVMDLEPFADTWRSFNWGVREVDGHNIKELIAALSSAPIKKGRPSVIIAHTIKGKGVSFMEDTVEWHYHTPNDEHLKKALEELK